MVGGVGSREEVSSKHVVNGRLWGVGGGLHCKGRQGARRGGEWVYPATMTAVRFFRCLRAGGGLQRKVGVVQKGLI